LKKDLIFFNLAIKGGGILKKNPHRNQITKDEKEKKKLPQTSIRRVRRIRSYGFPKFYL